MGWWARTPLGVCYGAGSLGAFWWRVCHRCCSSRIRVLTPDCRMTMAMAPAEGTIGPRRPGRSAESRCRTPSSRRSAFVGRIRVGAPPVDVDPLASPNAPPRVCGHCCRGCGQSVPSRRGGLASHGDRACIRRRGLRGEGGHRQEVRGPGVEADVQPFRRELVALALEGLTGERVAQSPARPA